MAPKIDPGGVEKLRRQRKRPKIAASGPRSTKNAEKHAIQAIFLFDRYPTGIQLGSGGANFALLAPWGRTIIKEN